LHVPVHPSFILEFHSNAEQKGREEVELVMRDLTFTEEEAMGSEIKSSETWKSGQNDQSTIGGLPKDSFGDAKRTAGSSASSSGGAISDRDLETLYRDFYRLKDTVGDLAQKQAAATTQQLAGTVGAVGQRVGATAAATQDTLMSFEGELEARVREKPLAAIVLSLLAGVVIGKLF
jgi:ElaB/YqjD/DUF883 family membrane-anchored ribosome-binding protein